MTRIDSARSRVSGLWDRVYTKCQEGKASPRLNRSLNLGVYMQLCRRMVAYA